MIATGQKDTRNPIHSRLIRDKFSRYQVEDSDQYKAKLKKMTMWDLSEEAVRAGLAPGSERDRIERTLMENFRKDKMAYDIALGKYEKPKEQKQKEPSEAVKEMLDFIKH